MAACTFLGHRDCPRTVFPMLKATIRKLIVEEGVGRFYVGTHGEFDRLARRALSELKEEFLSIEWVVVLAYLPTVAEKSESYPNAVYPEGMELVVPRFAIRYRNEWMIAHSEFLVAYVTRSFGGAAAGMQAAERKGKRCINLAGEENNS